MLKTQEENHNQRGYVYYCWMRGFIILLTESVGTENSLRDKYCADGIFPTVKFFIARQ